VDFARSNPTAPRHNRMIRRDGYPSSSQRRYLHKAS
jgi:hypothetical protein